MNACQKIRYRDRIAAQLVLAKIRHDDKTSRGKTEQRAYKCPDCGCWHLTSMKFWRGSRT